MMPSQVCWNCRDSGHILADCPHPRDNLQIRASRELFTAQREAIPDYAIPYLAGYTYTAEERNRRLDLLSRFTPGEISEDLKDAIFYIDEEEEGGEGILINPGGTGGIDGYEEDEGTKQMRIGMMKVRRNRGDWPWLEWMLKWGYPPGWVASKGE